MADEEHVKILKQGVEAWNRWRDESPIVRPDLSYAGLRGADLFRVDLSEANLSGADLFGADLREADLRETDLREAFLSEANLSEANLSGADLSEANLYDADLRAANLRNANLRRADLGGVIFHEISSTTGVVEKGNLRGTDFTEAKMLLTVFTSVNLSEAVGLDTVIHRAYSSIDIHTIRRSAGKIPEEFLRGAGVPDTFITYVTSLTGEAIQYYSCFISYSSKDESLAQRLHNDLQGKGVRCWFAPEDMKIGDKIRPTIDHAIRLRDKLLLILSENSINSDWVETEVETAFAEERRRKQTVLFPVRLDEMVMETNQAWAANIRDTRHIGDFCQWKDHDSYQQAFDRLLRDLKAEDQPSDTARIES